MRNKNGSWWQKPSKATSKDEDRVVSVIELFCDLVFVAYIGMISHNLVEHMDFAGISLFAVLFSIGWIIWLNSALYHDLHGNNDFKTRIVTFVQMIFIGFMAVFSHDVLHHSYEYFAGSLAGIILILGLLWRGTGIADPSHKVYSKPYARTYFLLVIGLVVTCFLAHEYRIWYLVAVAVILITPMLANYFLASDEIRKDYIKRLKLSHAFIERSNLLLIIVLGEVIIGSLNGFSTRTPSIETILILLFNFMIAFGLWFNHFEFVGHIQHKESISGYFMWLFSFYVETLMIALLGSIIYINYKYFNIDKLVIPTAIFFLATILHFTFNKKIRNPNFKLDTKHAIISMIASILVLTAIHFIEIQALEIILFMVALYIPVIMGVITWIRSSSRMQTN